MRAQRKHVGGGVTSGCAAVMRRSTGVVRVGLRLIACVMTVGGLARGAGAEVVPIVNAGFEELNVVLRAGEQTNGAGGVPGGSGLPETAVGTRWQFPFNSNGNVAQSGVIVPGWRTFPGAPGSLAGVLNPDVQFGVNPWMTGYSGSYVGAAQAAFMQQTLNVRLRPRTTYTLSFLAGIGITDSAYSPLIQLLGAPDLETFATPSAAGVTFLARMPLMQINRPQFGAMIPMSFSYTSPDVLGPELEVNGMGKFLAISFLGSDGIPRVVYDDFRLEAVAVPGPGVGVGLCAMMGVAIARRRRP